MSASPWIEMVNRVDREKVAKWRQKLNSDRDYDDSDESFVATVQQILDELGGGESIGLTDEALGWGDSTLSFVAGEGDWDERHKAIAWAVAATVPQTSKHELAKALRILEKYLGDEPAPHEAFRALSATAYGSAPLPGAVWKWLAERGPAYVHDGAVSAAYVRNTLERAHRGATKTIVATALEELSDGQVVSKPAEEESSKTSPYRGTGRKRTSKKRSLGMLAEALGTMTPSATGERVAFGEETVLGPESFAWLPARGSTALLKTMKLGDVPKPLIELAGWFQGAPSWAGRAAVARRPGEWVLVRLDRIVTPQDVAEWGDAFDATVLLSEGRGREFGAAEAVALALVAVSGGVALVTWSGPSCPIPIDESTATESVVSLCLWHW